MRYLSYLRTDGTASFGRVTSTDTVADLGTPRIPTMKAALAAGTLGTLAEGETFARSSLRLLPVIPDPSKVICVGVNYETHRLETGRAPVGHPTIFTRWADTLVAHEQPIVRPIESTSLDYEGELAVIIGKAGRRISGSDVMRHVAGYSIFNDASVRDWQRHTTQFTPGKNYPATGGLGPELVTPEEIDDLANQRIVTRLNGTVLQDQPIADMIWNVAAIIEYVSTFTALEPGDVIATGTPGGVGEKRDPQVFMKGGDLVEVSIGILGTLTNPVVDEVR